MTTTPNTTPQPTVAFAARSGVVFVDELADIIRAVRAQDFELICFCPFDEATRELESLGVTHVGVPVAERPEVARDAAAWLLMTSACIERRPLLIHSFDAALHLPVALAARAAHVPIAVATTLDHRPGRRSPLIDPLRTSVCHGVLARAAAQMDAWIVHNVSQATIARDEVGVAQDKLLTLEGGLGADLRDFSPGVDRAAERTQARARLRLGSTRSRWVGYVGPLDERHGDHLNAVLDGMARRAPDAGALIVARGGCDRGVVSRLRARRDYGDRVVVLTTRAMGELPLLYSAVDVLVAPIVSPGLHRSIAEAAAMRLPVVAYEHPSVRGWIEDQRTGRVVREGDRAGLLDALCAVLGEGRSRRDMGAVARKVAERRFDGEANRLRMFALYDELIRRNLGDP